MPAAGAATRSVGPPAAVAIRLLGGFAITLDDQPIPEGAWGRSRKARALAKLLALTPDHRLHRDQILDALWPDLDPEAAGPALYQVLYLLRRAFGPAEVRLRLQSEILALDPPGGLTTDLANFATAATAAQQAREPAAYEDALARYGGDLLPDDRYEEWTVAPREAARTTYLGLLRDFAALLEARGDRERAIAILDRLIAAEPADEHAHIAVMRLHAAAGRRAQALAQFGVLRAALKRDLDAEPDPASQRSYAAILAGHPSPAAKHPEGSSGGSARHNLPAAATSLIGRDATSAAIVAALDRSRLITLVGPGGIGKTRLALAVGHARRDASPGGVWLLDLATLQDAAPLDSTLAQVLGVRERADRPLREEIIAALQGRAALLVLDNCEHLIADCAALAAELLARCPDVRLLATSREALRADGEQLWQVFALPVPDERADFVALRENPAVQLFTDRARLVRPDFGLTDATAASVAAICRRLEGVPLAIELAAARVALLTPAQLAARLDDALRLLTGGPRTAPSRHQTLRATLDWSYRLLVAPERALLDRLAAFAGGCTLAAAEAVGSNEPNGTDDLAAVDILDTLAALVDKSLVQVELGRDAEGEPRYRLLETVRQFAAERLAAGGGATSCRARHAAYFLALAEETEPHLLGEHQARWLARVAHDLDNLRAALAWCAAHNLATGLRLASALDRFWLSGNYYREGIDWLTQGLLRAGGTIDPATRARANRAVALMMAMRADTRAIGFATESLRLYRALGDRDNEATVLNVLATVAFHDGDYERAGAAYAEARELWRGVGNTHGVAMASVNLANIHMTSGDLHAAAAIFAEMLPNSRTSGNPTLLATILANLNVCYAGTGRAAEARATQAEVISLLAASHDWVRFSFGGLVVTALIASGLGAPARAAQFLGAAAHLRATLALTTTAWQQGFVTRTSDEARAVLDETAWEEAFAAGAAWSIEESIAQTRDYLTR